MHIPVLLNETLTTLSLKPGDTVIDCTLGGGGHTQAMLRVIGSGGRLLGLDMDERTLNQTAKRLAGYPNVKLVATRFDRLEEVANEQGFSQVEAILFDLGMSSIQLDDNDRGISFQVDAPLDMRFDQSDTLTGAEIIRRWSESELAEIFFRYGDLYDAKRFARTIVEARRQQPIETTWQLVNTLGLKNPGVKAKLFQALRIATNDEMTSLEQAIPQAVSLLKPGGRVAIITFHSLEDRIVKHQFRDNHLLKLVTKKPIVPSQEEIKQNTRSRSAKLRVALKVT